MRAQAIASGHVPLLPRLVITSGTLEALKWLGLVLMVLDHVNKYLLRGAVPEFFAAGRLALPIFSFVLAYELARADSLARGVYARVARRLAIAGALASIPFIGLGGLGRHWWPLNILFTLLVVTTIMALSDRGGRCQGAAAIALFVIGGALVEFWWPALIMTMAAWRYVRKPAVTSLVIWVGATAALHLINQNFWALAALPLIFAAPRISLSLPRVRYAFYILYPLHLALLWLLAILGPW